MNPNGDGGTFLDSTLLSEAAKGKVRQHTKGHSTLPGYGTPCHRRARLHVLIRSGEDTNLRGRTGDGNAVVTNRNTLMFAVLPTKHLTMILPRKASLLDVPCTAGTSVGNCCQCTYHSNPTPLSLTTISYQITNSKVSYQHAFP